MSYIKCFFYLPFREDQLGQKVKQGIVSPQSAIFLKELLKSTILRGMVGKGETEVLCDNGKVRGKEG